MFGRQSVLIQDLAPCQGLSKKAIVKPLNKKPNLDPEVLSNYRTVSNLPYLSKNLERAVADQLDTHLDANNLHVKFQPVYGRGHSTETASLPILNDLMVMADLGGRGEQCSSCSAGS